MSGELTKQELDTLTKSFEDSEEESALELPRTKAKILILGKTGTGKSSIICRVFPTLNPRPSVGVGQPVTKWEDIEKEWTAQKCPIIIHDSQGLEISGDVERRLLGWLQCRTYNGDPIHAIWYVVSSVGARFEPSEIKFLSKLKDYAPCFVVLSKCDQAPPETIAALRQVILDELKGTIDRVYLCAVHHAQPGNPQMDPRAPSNPCSDCPNAELLYSKRDNVWKCGECRKVVADKVIHELAELCEDTASTFEREVREAFQHAQNLNHATKRKKTTRAIAFATAAAGAAGFSPIPFSDAFLLIPIQVLMVARLANIWGMPFDVKFLATLGITPVVSTSLGIGLATALKLIPGVGTVVGGGVSAGLAIGLTLAIGVMYATAFRTAWKNGWMDLTTEDLKEKLAALINAERFKQFAKVVAGTKDVDAVIDAMS